MKAVFLACVLLAVFGCASQQPKEAPQYPIQLELKGDTPFAPETVGSFKRGGLYLIKEGTSDNAIDYVSTVASKRAVAHRFIYEAESTSPNSLEREFKEVQLAIEAMYENAALVTEEPVSFSKGEAVREGYWSLHGIKEHQDDTAISVYSETYIFLVKGKFIKLRISYHADQREALRDDIKNLVRALIWVEIA